MQSAVEISEKQSILDEAKRNAFQAVNTGESTLQELGIQNETLHKTKDTLESNEYVLHKSMRILRGMTWSGYFYNMVTPQPLPITEKCTDQAGSSSAGSKSKSWRDTISTSTTASSHSRTDIVQSSAQQHILLAEQVNSKSAVSVTNDHDPDLLDLSRAVEQLHGISSVLAQTLEEQTKTLSDIESQTSKVHDKTLAVTIKSAQIINYTKTVRPRYFGRYHFEYLSGEGLCLSVNAEGDVIVTPTRDRSIYFDVIARDETIFALQNCKTLTFLRVTWTGVVRAVGQSFGSAEEMHIELRAGEATGLFFVNCNWGGGGWLQAPRPNDPNRRLSELSTGISNRGAAATFLAVKYEDKLPPESYTS